MKDPMTPTLDSILEEMESESLADPAMITMADYTASKMRAQVELIKPTELYTRKTDEAIAILDLGK